MYRMTPINLQQWIETHKEALKPPVANRCIWDEGDFIVMVVGGPNQRSDYHINQGEEIFYQLQGDMVLKVIENGRKQDIPIKEGELYLLKGGVPHSPQRFDNTVGLVIEKKREAKEDDCFQWYCDQCGSKLYETSAHIDDIVIQLPKVFERFYSNADHTTCKQCSTVAKR